MKTGTGTLLLLMALLVCSNSESVGQSDREGAGSGLGPVRGRGRSASHVASLVKSPGRTSSEARTLGVLRRVPQDYPTIQAAISACTDGDTVLVSEGTYVENIRYQGKAIIVASLYLIDGDTTHIDATIIDGSNPAHPDSGSVVSLIDGEDTTSVLCGLTIREGTGTRDIWPTLGWNRTGGGVYLRSPGARIVKNFITRNRIRGPGAWGGGVAAENSGSSYLILEGNRITDNLVHADSAQSYGYSGGADIYATSARIVGNVFERDTVIGANIAAMGGLGLYSDGMYAPHPQAYIQGNVFRANVLRATLGGAVGGGVYLGATGPVTMVENLIEGNVGTSVYNWAQGGGILVDDYNTLAPGRKVIERNRIAGNRLTRGGGSENSGSGVFLYYATATLNANEIAGNVTNGAGGGVASYRSSFRVQNNIITGNSAANGGGGVDVNYPASFFPEQVLVHNTIALNYGGSYGGGVRANGVGARLHLLNTILWGDTAFAGKEIYLGGSAVAWVNYCDVEGGIGGGVGNINQDPGFEAGCFDIGQTSSCLEAGRDTLGMVPAADFHGASRPQPVATRPDIGACESPYLVGVDEGQEAFPLAFDLLQNYPNPFNPATAIQFAIADRQLTIVKVYDVLGQEVATLVNEVKEPGAYTVRWDAGGMSSGVYFYRLTAGGFVQTKRMMVVK